MDLCYALLPFGSRFGLRGVVWLEGLHRISSYGAHSIMTADEIEGIPSSCGTHQLLFQVSAFRDVVGSNALFA